MNKKILLLFFIIFLCVQTRETLRKINQFNKKPIPIPTYTQRQLWFTQLIDHYDYTQSQYFQQRYFIIEDFFDSETGPVFLFICGQYVCPGVPQSRKWAIVLAQRTKGLILVLQHRYYGKSLPFGQQSLNLQNMKLLNSQQALKDLAYFTQVVKEKKLHNVQNNPWIAIGGSYPGALSAWYRYKYPHLTVGAIASSAVINAFQLFDKFDEQVYISSMRSGSQCVDALRSISDYVESQVVGPSSSSFLAQYGAQKLSARQFLWFWADVIAETVQYGGRVELCANLKNKTLAEQYNYVKKLALQSDPSDYGSYYLSNQTFAIQNGGGARAWIFQSCTEFGWLQPFSKLHPIRSKLLTIQFFRKWCQDSFGPLLPDVDRVNNQFGSLDQLSTNLILVNGAQDPWLWASLVKNKNNIISKVASCPTCAHCVQLYTPSSSDSSDLVNIRNQEYKNIQKWISQYWKIQKPNLQLEYQQLNLID